MIHLDEHIARAMAYSAWSGQLNSQFTFDLSHLFYGIIRTEREYRLSGGVRDILGDDKADSIECHLCQCITDSAADREMTRVYPIWKRPQAQASPLLLSVIQQCLYVSALRNHSLSLQTVALGALICGGNIVLSVRELSTSVKTQLIRGLCRDSGIAESDFRELSMCDSRLYEAESRYLCSPECWLMQDMPRRVPYPKCLNANAKEALCLDDKECIVGNAVLRNLGLVDNGASGGDLEFVRGRKVLFDKVAYNALCFIIEAATSLAEPVIEVEWIRLGFSLASHGQYSQAKDLLAAQSGSEVIRGRGRDARRAPKRIARILENGNCIPPDSLEVLIFG